MWTIRSGAVDHVVELLTKDPDGWEIVFGEVEEYHHSKAGISVVFDGNTPTHLYPGSTMVLPLVDRWRLKKALRDHDSILLGTRVRKVLAKRNLAVLPSGDAAPKT